MWFVMMLRHQKPTHRHCGTSPATPITGLSLQVICTSATSRITAPFIVYVKTNRYKFQTRGSKVMSAKSKEAAEAWLPSLLPGETGWPHAIHQSVTELWSD